MIWHSNHMVKIPCVDFFSIAKRPMLKLLLPRLVFGKTRPSDFYNQVIWFLLRSQVMHVLICCMLHCIQNI